MLLYLCQILDECTLPATYYIFNTFSIILVLPQSKYKVVVINSSYKPIIVLPGPDMYDFRINERGTAHGYQSAHEIGFADDTKVMFCTDLHFRHPLLTIRNNVLLIGYNGYRYWMIIHIDR